MSDSLWPHGLWRQASLSLTSFWSLPKFTSIHSVMPSNHLVLCRPLLLLPSTFRSLILSHLDVSAFKTSSKIEDKVPCFVATASALADVRAPAPGNGACPFASLSLPLVWKLHEGGVHVSYILSTPGSSECPCNRAVAKSPGLWVAAPWRAEAASRLGAEGRGRAAPPAAAALPGRHTLQRQDQ